MKKKMFNLFLASILSVGLSAQSPEAFKYQAVVRDVSSNIIANQSVSFQISILQGNSSGLSVYTETHTITTNTYGLANMEVGNGTLISGNFSTIDWANDIYFVQVEMDPAGGSSYALMGSSQLQSVPYALNAKTAENVFDGDFNSLANVPTNVSAFTNDSGYITNADDADADPNNELQTISKTGSSVTLSNGGGSFTDDVNDADADATNELQIISLATNTITLTNGGGSVSLTPYLDNTDAQDLSLSGNSLGITNDATSVDLSVYLDNTDAQTLSITGNNLNISGGNNVDLTNLVTADSNWTVNGAHIFNSNSGNVGIGTTTPNSKLNVLGSGTILKLDGDGIGSAEMSIYSNNAGQRPGITLGRTSDETTWGVAPSNGIYSSIATIGDAVLGAYGTAEDLIFANVTVGDIRFSTGISDTEKMTITNGGNVGIGTTAPNDLLHIYGNSGNKGLLIETAGNLSTDFAAIRFYQGGGERGQFFTNQNDIYLNSSSATAGDDVLLGVNTVGLQLGNVGIGTTTPNSKLNVLGSGTILKLDGDGIGSAEMSIYSNNAGQRPGITLGRTSDETTWGVAPSNGIYSSIATTGDAVLGAYGTAEDLIFANVTAGDIRFSTGISDTEKMTITNGGNVGIGTTTPTAKLSVNGSANKPGGGSWAVFSDERLKKNVNTYTDGLSTLLKIETKTFQYNGKAGIRDTDKVYVGIIAQDMQKIAPYMVREVKYENKAAGEKDNYLEFDPSAMDFMIVNAIKEMHETMTEMKEKMGLLEKENVELKELVKLK
jgi:hypothetical protein